MRRFVTLACALAILPTAALSQTTGPAAPSAAVQVSAVDLAQAGASGSWLTYGHDYSNQRYSPLTQITTANVASLTPAFVFQTGVAAPFETTPIVADGK